MQEQIVDIPLTPDVLHVPINVRMGRIVGERRIIVEALFAELPVGRVLHHPLLIERAVEIGVRLLYDAPTQVVVFVCCPILGVNTVARTDML